MVTSLLASLTRCGWSTTHTRGSSQLDTSAACRSYSLSYLLTLLLLLSFFLTYSLSTYGLDFVFHSQLEGQHNSRKHRKNLGCLGQTPAWDPLRRKCCHGSFAVPWAGAMAVVATLRQLCWPVKVISICWVIRKVPASLCASVIHPSICLRYTKPLLSFRQEMTCHSHPAVRLSGLEQTALAPNGMQLLLRVLSWPRKVPLRNKRVMYYNFRSALCGGIQSFLVSLCFV